MDQEDIEALKSFLHLLAWTWWAISVAVFFAIVVMLVAGCSTYPSTEAWDDEFWKDELKRVEMATRCTPVSYTEDQPERIREAYAVRCGEKLYRCDADARSADYWGQTKCTELATKGQP